MSGLTREEDIDAHALHKRGWTISATARHLGRDRKTIRSYLTGERQQGVRAPSGDDRFERFVPYVTARLREDPHLWAMTLFDELAELGFEQSHPTLTRQIRDRQLRPRCEACAVAKHRPIAVIEHPPGEEIQWDWVDLPNPPPAWGFDSRRCCWWARSRTRGSGAVCCVSRWTKPTSSTRWTGSAGRSAASARVALRPHGHGL